jgi:hypothetical protein
MVGLISPSRHDTIRQKNDINYFFIILFNVKSYIFSSNLIILNKFLIKNTKNYEKINIFGVRLGMVGFIGLLA